MWLVSLQSLPAVSTVSVYSSLIMSVSPYRTKWAKVDNRIVYISLKVLSSWRLDKVYLVVDSDVFLMYVQFMSLLDHSVMHWLNFGLKHKFLDTTTGCSLAGQTLTCGESLVKFPSSTRV